MSQAPTPSAPSPVGDVADAAAAATIDLETDALAADELPSDLIREHGWGFFVFVACTIALAFAALRPEPQAPDAKSHPDSGKLSLPLVEAQAAAPPGAKLLHAEAAMSLASAPAAEHGSNQAAEGARAAAMGRSGMIGFESGDVMTSEKASAAVFILVRTSTRGRASVRWAARSGTADAAIDFSDASGTASFADGQDRLAIYVPLRDDLLPEEQETFTVCLRSRRQASAGAFRCAEATILDDDASAL
jgi:hypothetical protein